MKPARPIRPACMRTHARTHAGTRRREMRTPTPTPWSIAVGAGRRQRDGQWGRVWIYRGEDRLITECACAVITMPGVIKPISTGQPWASSGVRQLLNAEATPNPTRGDFSIHSLRNIKHTHKTTFAHNGCCSFFYHTLSICHYRAVDVPIVAWRPPHG